MGMREKAKKLGRDLADKKKQAKVKKAVRESLMKAKAKIKQVEKKLRDPRTRERAKAELAKLKARVRELKMQYKKAEKKAVQYTEKNPKKALAVAAAVGVVAGLLFAALNKKKS